MVVYLSTLTTCNQCNLLYTLFDLSALTTWVINTLIIVLCSFYFSLYSTHHLLLSCIMVVFLHLSTLTTLIQYIVYHNRFWFFRRSRHIFCFASNFLNNGPIFNPIRLLESSQCPLSLCGVKSCVYFIFTYLLTLTTWNPLFLMYF